MGLPGPDEAQLHLGQLRRGDLVDNQALRKALIDGTIRGAALDTIFPEPTPGDHPLVDLPPEVRDRVVYSSHLGGSSGGAFAKRI